MITEAEVRRAVNVIYDYCNEQYDCRKCHIVENCVRCTGTAYPFGNIARYEIGGKKLAQAMAAQIMNRKD